MRALLLLLSLSAPAFAQGRVILPWGEPPPPRIAPVYPARENLPRLYFAATFGVALPLGGLAVGPAAGIAAGYQTPWWSDRIVVELGVSGLHSRRSGALTFPGANSLASNVFLYDEIRNQTEVLATVFVRAAAFRGIEVSAGLGPDLVLAAEHLDLYGQVFTARSTTPGAHATLAADFRFGVGDFVLQSRLHATSDAVFTATRALQHVAMEAGYRLWF